MRSARSDLLGPLTVSLFSAILEELQPLVAEAPRGAADSATQAAVPIRKRRRDPKAKP
jgi:hypothetical protein